MKSAIEQFLQQKNLSENSKAAYTYDLEQFLDQVGTITDTNLRFYQSSLQSLKPSAQKRKLSAVNQFLLFLYEQNQLERYYKLAVPKDTQVVSSKSTLLELRKYPSETYLFEKKGKPYSRQWAFRQLEAFLHEKGQASLSAQSLREQYILRQLKANRSLHDIARDLGLKGITTLEKYR